MSTFAIGVGVDPDDLRVTETPDNFGAFATEEAAAQRLIEMTAGRIGVLKRSANRARRIIRKARKGGQPHD